MYNVISARNIVGAVYLRLNMPKSDCMNEDIYPIIKSDSYSEPISEELIDFLVNGTEEITFNDVYAYAVEAAEKSHAENTIYLGEMPEVVARMTDACLQQLIERRDVWDACGMNEINNSSASWAVQLRQSLFDQLQDHVGFNFGEMQEDVVRDYCERTCESKGDILSLKAALEQWAADC